jgi:hypothetical protein
MREGLQKVDWTQKPWDERGWEATSKHRSARDLVVNPPSKMDGITVINDGNQTGAYYRLFYWVKQPIGAYYTTYTEVGTFQLLSEEQVEEIRSAKAGAIINVPPFGMFQKDKDTSCKYVSMMVHVSPLKRPL